MFSHWPYIEANSADTSPNEYTTKSSNNSNIPTTKSSTQRGPLQSNMEFSISSTYSLLQLDWDLSFLRKIPIVNSSHIS